MVSSKQPGRVVILGAGIVGLSTAYAAAQRGWHVTVLDRRPEAGDNCSRGNAGMIVPSHFVPLAAPGMVQLGLRWMASRESPFALRWQADPQLWRWAYRFMQACRADHVERAAPLLRDLHQASRAMVLAWAQQHPGAFRVNTRGLLMLCQTEKMLEHETALANDAQRWGIDARVLDAAGVRASEPETEVVAVGGVHYPGDATLCPAALLDFLTAACRQAGVDLVWNCHVQRLAQRGDRVARVETNQGVYEADEVVVAAGAWSADLLRPLGLRLLLQPGKGYSLTVPTHGPSLHHGLILTEARVAVTPMLDGQRRLRFAGTMEIGAMDSTIDLHRVRGILGGVARCLPEWTPDKFEGIETWSGLRPCSPDGLPYLGRSARVPNLIVATGHAMMGLSLGPITGHLVGELLDGESPSIDIAALAIHRYGDA